jgi:hypothetical protein
MMEVDTLALALVGEYTILEQLTAARQLAGTHFELERIRGIRKQIVASLQQS